MAGVCSCLLKLWHENNFIGTWYPEIVIPMKWSFFQWSFIQKMISKMISSGKGRQATSWWHGKCSSHATGTRDGMTGWYLRYWHLHRWSSKNTNKGPWANVNRVLQHQHVWHVLISHVNGQPHANLYMFSLALYSAGWSNRNLTHMLHVWNIYLQNWAIFLG